MEYIYLGNSDLKVSKVCLGCMGFGSDKGGIQANVGEEEARKIAKKYNNNVKIEDKYWKLAKESLGYNNQ